MTDDRTTDRDDELHRRARRAFDASVERLDGERLSALNRGRHAALAAAGNSRRPGPWLAATGVAATAVAAAVLVPSFMPGSPGDELAAPAEAADFELLLDADDLDMLEELEFYAWLDAQDDAGNAG